MSADEFRIEHDTMGEVRVPAAARWAAQTQRAVENFPVSGLRVEPALIHPLGANQAAAADANPELAVLEADWGYAHSLADSDGARGCSGGGVPSIDAQAGPRPR